MTRVLYWVSQVCTSFYHCFLHITDIALTSSLSSALTFSRFISTTSICVCDIAPRMTYELVLWSIIDAFVSWIQSFLKTEGENAFHMLSMHRACSQLVLIMKHWRQSLFQEDLCESGPFCFCITTLCCYVHLVWWVGPADVAPLWKCCFMYVRLMWRCCEIVALSCSKQP